MKQTLFILSTAIIVAFSISSCKKKNKPDIIAEIPITMSKLLPAIDSPFNQISLPIEITDTFATKLDEYVTQFGFTKDKIKSVKASYLNVVVDNGTSQTLNFVDDSVKVYVDKFNGTNPILVAYAKAIPMNATSLNFAMTDYEIKDLFNNQYMQITLKFNTRVGEKIIANANFITNFKFKIVADGN